MKFPNVKNIKEFHDTNKKDAWQRISRTVDAGKVIYG